MPIERTKWKRERGESNAFSSAWKLGIWGLWALFLFLSLYVCVCVCVKTGPFGFVVLAVLPAAPLLLLHTHTENKGGDAHSQSGTKARIFCVSFQRRIRKTK